MDDWAVDADPAAEALLAVIDAATIAAGHADRDLDDVSVLLQDIAAEALDAASRVRKLTRRWVRDGVRVVEAAQALQRRRELLDAAAGVQASAAERLADAQLACAAANRQLAGAGRPR